MGSMHLFKIPAIENNEKETKQCLSFPCTGFYIQLFMFSMEFFLVAGKLESVSERHRADEWECTLEWSSS